MTHKVWNLRVQVYQVWGSNRENINIYNGKIVEPHFIIIVKNINVKIGHLSEFCFISLKLERYMYSWNIVESGVKHHSPNPLKLESLDN